MSLLESLPRHDLDKFVLEGKQNPLYNPDDPNSMDFVKRTLRSVTEFRTRPLYLLQFLVEAKSFVRTGSIHCNNPEQLALRFLLECMRNGFQPKPYFKTPEDVEQFFNDQFSIGQTFTCVGMGYLYLQRVYARGQPFIQLNVSENIDDGFQPLEMPPQYRRRLDVNHLSLMCQFGTLPTNLFYLPHGPKGEQEKFERLA